MDPKANILTKAFKKAFKKLTETQRYEVINYQDRIFYAAIEDGFDSKKAAEVANIAAERKVKELAAKAAFSETLTSIEWKCPVCSNVNHDSRKKFVICIECGQTYPSLPLGKP